jgi:hypothetical protein
MATWAEFETAAPELAVLGWDLCARDDHGEALIATVRGDELPPRVHPIGVDIVDGHLYAFINDSPKRHDLEADGRYALHNHVDAARPREFMLRGRATPVSDPLRSRVAGGWYFEPDDSYRLFELSIDSALLGLRDDPDEWPPRYRSWRPDRGIWPG